MTPPAGTHADPFDQGKGPEAVAANPEPAVIQRAAEWMARLWSGDATEADHLDCATWRAAAPSHEQAWLQLQQVEQTLLGIPTQVTRHALAAPVASGRATRRRAMQLLGLGMTLGSMGYLARSTGAWALLAADSRTGTGEVRSLTLPDGTQLVLASASAVDVRFTEQERLIELRTGEILVTSGHGPDAATRRPLRVRSRHGTVEALGTRFSVRQSSDATDVAVFEGAVRVRPAKGHAAAIRLQAGEGALFTEDAVQAAHPVQEGRAAWSQGLLVADAMPLAEFIDVLSRYRPGLLRCDPAVADLRVSGVFSLRDTDRALHNLALALPVATTYRTRYWVTVHSR